MRSLVRYMRDARWPRQHVWRKAIWQAMGNVGLTGMHVLPVHKSWVDFAHYPMAIRGLPAGLEGRRIIQISDLHCSPMVRASYLWQFMDWINELQPAVVVVTGDLFMGGRRYAHQLAHMLARLKTSHGVLCILGNHDYGLNGKAMADRGGRRVAHLQSVLVEHDIQLLRNQSWRMRGTDGKGLSFVGLDDEWSGRMRPDEAFASVDALDPVVCLVHNPAMCLQLLHYPWQWMLTGHTHGRQMAQGPVGKRLFPGSYRRFTHGLYTINGRHLYVNRGLSYGQRHQHWCRPEITVFDLRAAAK